MSKAAISAQNLSKAYRIGTSDERYYTLRDSIAAVTTAPLRRIRSALRRAEAEQKRKDETIWALSDVSFEVEQGEVVGIIGCNGAGKSTLLKILSKITWPTKGSADIRGRVASLLEVGTGFHPELTGRENVYLNGVLLGMKKAEIDRKFDEIIDFAEIHKFIDTPGKRYSSGMAARLAFAVAAHLEADILFVDEVLAVGDVAFQKKCLGRMGEVASQGKTVLFVSHNMGAVRSLCDRGIVLYKGAVIEDGSIGGCIERYYESIGLLKDGSSAGRDRSSHTADAGFGSITLPGVQGNTIDQSHSLAVETVFRLDQATNGFRLIVVLEDMRGGTILNIEQDSAALGLSGPSSGEYRVRVEFPPLWLNPGLYSIQFKVLPWGTGAWRYLSDKFPLDVAGANSRSASSLLHPRSVWSIQSCLESCELHMAESPKDTLQLS